MKPNDLTLKRHEAHLGRHITSFSDFGPKIREVSDIVDQFGSRNASDLLTEISRELDQSLEFLRAP